MKFELFFLCNTFRKVFRGRISEDARFSGEKTAAREGGFAIVTGGNDGGNAKAAVSKSKRIAYVYRAAMLVLLCVFAVSACMLFRYAQDGRRNEAFNERLRTVLEKGLQAPAADREKNCALLLAELKRLNPDVTGWLLTEDGAISYPIVQGADNERYLTTGADGKRNGRGAVFMDYRNGPFTDFNTVLYGHNMRDGSMFGALADIGADPVREKGRVLTLSEGGFSVWEVFSARTVDIGKEKSPYAIAYGENRADMPSEVAETWAGFDAESRILTLSTCVRRVNDNYRYRYVVQARLTEHPGDALPIKFAS